MVQAVFQAMTYSTSLASPPRPSRRCRRGEPVTRRTAALVLGLVLAPGLLALGCGPQDDEPYDDGPEPTELRARVLVGTVEGTDLALGALLDGDTLAVYQCGGDTTFASHTRWFRGLVGAGDDPDGFELVVDDMTLVGIRTADGLEGELVEPDGTRRPFAVDPVDDDDQPGIYVATHDGLSTGVVVREQDGELVAQGASCTDERECFQVIILPPLDVTTEGIAVQVQTDDARLDTVVARTLEAP